MRTLSRRTLAAACGWVLLAASAAAAEDITVVSKVTRDNAAPSTSTSYFTSDRMRASQGDNEFMAEYGSGTFTMIDHRKKEYSVVTKADIDAMAEQMNAQMKQLEAQMANVPPEARKQMQSLMGAISQNVEVKRGEGGRTIAGYACENWIITIGEMVKTQHCVTSQLQYPVQAWDSFKSFSSAMSRAAGPMGKGMAQMWDKMKEMKGVPLATTTTTSVMGRTITHSSEVTEIRKGPIPASAWELPAGYKKVDSPLGKMPRQK
jgi:hypothetical protein